MSGGRRPTAWLVAASLALVSGCSDTTSAAPVLSVDPEGFCRMELQPEWVEAYPAEGFRCLLPAGGSLVGRVVEGGVSEASVRVRDAEGRLSTHTLRVHGVSDPLAAEFRAALAAAAEEGVANPSFSRVVGALTSGAGGPVPPVGAPPPIGKRRSLGADPGRMESVLDGAPDDLVFVRVRSVEAAYRFADELDRLDFLLRAAAGDARDFGTLAGTLRDLHLPSIWQTNPEAERGVDELAVVLAPALGRGRQRAAVLLHVIDANLHHQQTEARKAGLPPASDDPFPERRTRRNFRRIVDDVEVVATDAELLEYVATRSAYSIRRMTPYLRTRARLNDGKLTPPPTEALMLYISPAARERLRSTQDGFVQRRRAEERAQGLHWLAARWTGLPAPGGRSLAADEAQEHALVHVEWLVVTTSVDGAHVRLRFTSPERAETAAEALRALTRSEGAWAEACARNLRGIAPVSLVEPDQTELADRVRTLLGWRPVCPSGGTYSTDPVRRTPRCTEHGNTREPRDAQPPDARVDHLGVHAGELSFDLRIDWDADTSRPR